MRINTLTLAAGAIVALASSSALADEAPVTPGGTVTTTTPPPVVHAAAPSAPAASDKEDATPDHEKFAGKFAVGYLGLAQLPIGGVGGAGGNLALNKGTVPAPVIGVRYWLSTSLGIDAGLGLGVTSGSTETANNVGSVSTDKPSQWGLAFHGGVPLAFASAKHFTFLAIPELNFGFTSGTIKAATPNTPDTNLSGLHLDLGGRIGSEVHFGFIGIPQLSLQATVGLRLAYDKAKVSQGPNSVTDSTTALGTTVESAPWAIFVNNISAFYYFP